MQFDVISLFFWLFALIAFLFGLGVITARNPMHSAISLVLTLVALAGLFLLLHAEFLAWILIIVYTGAVMVLIIFVISLLNVGTDEPIRMTPARSWGMLVIGTALLAFFFYLYRDPGVGFAQPLLRALPAELQWGSAQVIGMEMFTRYLLPFELAAILLTAAVIAAILIARKPLEKELEK